MICPECGALQGEARRMAEVRLETVRRRWRELLVALLIAIPLPFLIVMAVLAVLAYIAGFGRWP